MIVGCTGFPPGGERVIAVLDRKYFVELLLNAVFTFVVITTVALLGIAPIALYRLPGLSFGVYLHYVSYLLVQALSYLMPLTMLIAVVFVYGRAAADHEVTTLKASGIHPFRVLVPGLLLALLVGFACLEVESSLGPSAIYQLRAMPASQATLQPLIERAIAERQKSLSFDDREGSITISWVSAEVPERGGAILSGILFEQEPKRAATHGQTVAPVADEERIMISAKEARVPLTSHHEVTRADRREGADGQAARQQREVIELRSRSATSSSARACSSSRSASSSRCARAPSRRSTSTARRSRCCARTRPRRWRGASRSGSPARPRRSRSCCSASRSRSSSRAATGWSPS